MISGARSFPFKIKTVHFNCLLYYKLVSCFEELVFSSPTSHGEEGKQFGELKLILANTICQFP